MERAEKITMYPGVGPSQARNFNLQGSCRADRILVSWALKTPDFGEGNAVFEDIRKGEHWRSVLPVDKGWSREKKYVIETEDGKQLLRISPIESLNAKRREYAMVQKFARCGFPMSQPLDFGICADGEHVYMRLTWVEGRDLEEVLPELPEAEQYACGREAGEILRQIHGIPVAPMDAPRETKQAKKLLQLERYEHSRVRVPGDEPVIRFVRENIDLLWQQKPVYLHGDFHPGNLIYTPEKTIGVIDFNRWEVGDPYEEFYKLQSFGVENSIPYSVGQVDAYFRGKVPEDFWGTLAVYVAHASLYSILWAEKFGQKDIDGMVRRYHMAMEENLCFRRLKNYLSM